MSAHFDRTDFERALGARVAARVEAHRALLAEWSPRINLIGPRELDEYWRRHALDCAQLVKHAPHAKTWVDLGSGAGLPGLIIAALIADEEGARVTLVETNAKKVAFLREAARAMSVPADVLHDRIENIASRVQNCDVVTARALAPLPQLIEHANPILDRGAQGLFLKGADVDAELAALGRAQHGGAFHVEVLESESDPGGRIVRVTKAATL